MGTSGPQEADHSLKTGPSKGASISQSSGGRIPYPKHVWSPSGGWYAQPANWKANTSVFGAIIFGICCVTWSISADRERRDRFPELGRFYPSRYWSKDIIEHEKALKAAKESQ